MLQAIYWDNSNDWTELLNG